MLEDMPKLETDAGAGRVVVFKPCLVGCLLGLSLSVPSGSKATPFTRVPFELPTSRSAQPACYEEKYGISK